MSLSSDDASGRPHGIDLLTKDNYLVWSEKIKDYILGLESLCDGAQDMWDASTWEPDLTAHREADDNEGDEGEDYEPDVDPAAIFSNLPNDTAPRRKTKQQHNKAFGFIRRTLSASMFEKTLGKPTNVPLLLRLLKGCWNDNTTQDRDRMRQEYDDLSLVDYADMDRYITTYNNKVRVMRQHNMGLVANDEDVLFHFNKTLPQAWQTHIDISTASGHSLTKTHAYYLKCAARDESLPGTTRVSKRVESVHNTTEVCRGFARGRCKFGSSCRYLHTTPPQGFTPSASRSTDDGGQRKITCFYCKKQGHRKADCRKRQADIESKKKAADQ